MKCDFHSFRNKGYLILIGIFVTFLHLPGSGQQVTKEAGNFKPFASISSTDQSNTYITADLSQLPAFFERAYLLDLIFTDPKLVVNNSNITGSTLELFSGREYDPTQVLMSLQTYRDKAMEAGKNLSVSQKEELIKKYEKYR